MKISNELIQGFALGEPMLRAVGERVVGDAALAEDEAIMGPEASVKTRFRELLAQHPEMTRPQAYLLAVMEKIGYRGYLVPPELAPGILASLESNDEITARTKMGTLLENFEKEFARALTTSPPSMTVTGDGAGKPRKPQLVGCPFLPCPHCGTLNPPDAIECGTGRQEGCGASLREQ